MTYSKRFKAATWFLAVALLLNGMTFSVSAEAALQCSQVFSQNETTPLEMYNLVRKLNNAYLDFYQDVAGRSRLVSKRDLQQRLQNLELVTDEYFDKAGIAYVKTEKKVPSNPDSAHWDGATYSLYTVTVDQARDTNAKLLKGFELKTRKQVRLIFDPLLNLSQGETGGFFNPLNNSITFSYSAISFRYLGLSDILRHEMQHAFEYQKVLGGEHSLSRFTLNSEATNKEPYSDFASMDELESYLREIRLMQNPTKTLNETLEAAGTSKPALESYRQKELLWKVQFLKSFAVKSQIVLKNLRESIEKEEIEKASFDLDGTFKVTYKVNKAAYSKASLTLSGLDADGNIRTQIKTKALEEISWAEQRIQMLLNDPALN